MPNGVLDVIHKCWRTVISAGMPKSSVQGWQNGVTTDIPISKEMKLQAGKLTLIKHLHNRLVTVHGLDFGIHAEMTAFPDLCKTMRMERYLIQTCRWSGV